ncbi:hypothetical protein [Amycolatopsis sp. NPDC051128]|uniref:hypothetical protein n=1 Tax=Amycolatopsis sp. NPDC051128 TaxID=3155412 RepID=UPI0034149023
MTEQTMMRLVAKYAAATSAKLIEQTAVINAIANDLSDENYRDRHVALLEAEQNRRCVADVATARILAGREDVARSMATDDLQEMLPDFEQVAALCGIRPDQAEANRQIVITELRRRGIEA